MTYFITLPFAVNHFVLVSRSEKPLQPDLPGTLPGKSIGLTLGYVYPGIDEWIQRADAAGLDGQALVDEYTALIAQFASQRDKQGYPWAAKAN